MILQPVGKQERKVIALVHSLNPPHIIREVSKPFSSGERKAVVPQDKREPKSRPFNVGGLEHEPAFFNLAYACKITEVDA